MELNVDKIKREMERLGITFIDVAKANGFGSRQHAHYYLHPKKLKAAEYFAKVLRVDPKDLLKN
jgi:nitrogen regulatory protein PII